MRLAIVVMLLFSLLAGCTDDGGSGPTLATARQAQPAAERAALRWADDAVLVGASTFELDDEARREARDDLQDSREELREARDDGDLEDDEYDNVTAVMKVYDRMVAVDDDSPGDGRAPVWFFNYWSDTEETQYAVAVARGQVIYSDAEAAYEFSLDDAEEPLGEWVVDSDEASAAAALGNPDYSVLCDAANIMTFLWLTEGDNGPLWTVRASRQDDARDSEGPRNVLLAVDATTGALVQDEVDPAINLLYQESGSLDGDLTGLVQATLSDSFEVLEDGHLAWAVDAAVSPAPPQPVHVTITDPGGNVTTLDLALGTNTVARGFAVIDTGAPAGVYEVEIEVELALASQYSISWCTDGVPTAQGQFQERACNRLPEEDDDEDPDARGETLSRFPRWLAAW